MNQSTKFNAFSKVLALLLAVIMVIPAGFTLVDAAASDWVDGTDYPTIEGLTIKTSAAYKMTYADGVFASTNQGQGSKTSGLKITTADACIFTFEAKVSSEANWDGLRYGTTEMVNSQTGSVIDKYGFSGTKDWTSFSLALSAEQSIYIVYYKDGSGNGGSDTMWLRNFVAEAPEYCNITVSSEDTNKGTASITSGVTNGQAVKTGSVTVKATPKSGYRFNGWYNGASRVSTSTSYTFTVSADVALAAKFDAKVKDLTATYHLPAHASATYKVTREGSAFVAAGTALPADGVISGLWQDDSVALTLTLDSDYKFLAWYSDSALSSQYSTTQDLSNTIGTSNIEYWAKVVYEGWGPIEGVSIDGFTGFQTRQMYPFGYADGAFYSTNKNIGNSLGVMKATATKSGYLALTYHTETESGHWDFLVYGLNADMDMDIAKAIGYTSSSPYYSIGKYFSGQMTDWKTEFIPITAGDTIYFGYKKDSGGNGSGDDTVRFSMQYLSELTYCDITYTSEDTSKGTVSSTGITGGKAVKDTSVKLTATPKDGYICDGIFLVNADQSETYAATFMGSPGNAECVFTVSADATYIARFVPISSWTVTVHIPDGLNVYFNDAYNVNGTLPNLLTPDENGIATVTATPKKCLAFDVVPTSYDITCGGFYADSAYTIDTGITYSNSWKHYYDVVTRLYYPGHAGYGNEIWIKPLGYVSISGNTEPDANSGVASIETKDDNYAWTYDAENDCIRSANMKTSYTVSQMRVTADKTGLLYFDVKTYCERSRLFVSVRVMNEPATKDNYENSLNIVTQETWRGGNYEGGEDHYTGETEWETVCFPIQSGDTLYIALFVDTLVASAQGRDNIAYLRNFHVVEGTVDCQIDYDDTYGDVFMENAAQGGAVLGATATFRAVPKVESTGAVGQFFRWENADGTVYSYEPTISFSVTEDIHLVARFIAMPSGQAFLSYSGLLFDSFNAAFTFAQSNPAVVDVTANNPQGNPVPVVLLESKTLTADITVPNGVIFLVPYSDDSDKQKVTVRSKYGHEPEFPYSNTDFYRHTNAAGKEVTDAHPAITYSDDQVFRTLTMASGASVNVANGGAFVVGGMFSGGQPIGGGTYGSHSNVVLGENSHINVTTGGVFSTFGYILGEGTVEVTGGTVYEPFIVTDFHGGTYTGAQYLNKTTPFGSYAMINIQTDLTMNSGSKIVGYCSLYAQSTQNMTHVTMIGPAGQDAMFNLNDGTLTTHYNADKAYTVKGMGGTLYEFGQKTLDINGNAAVGAMSMRLLEIVPVTTADVAFPVPCNIKVVIEGGNILDIPIRKVLQYVENGDDYDEVYEDAQILMALLPGTEVWIKQDAALNISGGLYVLDGMAAKVYSAGSYYGSDMDTTVFSDRAHLIVDGALNVYSDAVFAGIVETNGTGYIYADEGAILEGTYYDGVLKGWTALSGATSTNRTGYPLKARLLDSATGALIDIKEDVEYTGNASGSFDLSVFNYTEFSGDKDNYTETPAVGSLTNATICGSWDHGDYQMFSGHSLTVEGDIDVNFFMDVRAAGATQEEIINGDKDLELTFAWVSGDDAYTDVSAFNTTVDENNYDEFVVGGYFKVPVKVAAAEMNLGITVTATVDGVSTTEVYSIRKYADTVLDETSTFSTNYKNTYGADKYDALVDLVESMLDYGAKAQEVFEIDTANPANKDVDYTTADVTVAMIESAISAANTGITAISMRDSDLAAYGLEYQYSTVVYLSGATLRHYYSVTALQLYNAAKANGVLKGVNESKIASGVVYFEFDDVPAAEFANFKALNICGKTYYSSVLTYARAVIKAGAQASDAQADLAKATYWYYIYAKAYFNA